MKTDLHVAWVENRSSNSGYMNGICIMSQVVYRQCCRCALSISVEIHEKNSQKFADNLPDIEKLTCSTSAVIINTEEFYIYLVQLTFSWFAGLWIHALPMSALLAGDKPNRFRCCLIGS